MNKIKYYTHIFRRMITAEGQNRRQEGTGAGFPLSLVFFQAV